jgi:ferredoxin-NADP reductase
MAIEPVPARPPTVTTFDAVVLESIVETPDTRTLVLDTAVPSTYRAGQYVSIDPGQFAGLRSFTSYLEHAKGRHEPPRAYSMCSAPHEPHVAITVKEEVYDAAQMKYPPLLSGYLVHQVRAGDRLLVSGFVGGYMLPDDVEARTSHILHLCAGSGSVPNLSILKDSLHRHQHLRHTFLYSNKTWDDVIFREELTRLAHRHPSRLRVVHTLTRQSQPPEGGADVRLGRMTADLVQEALEAAPDTLVYACGPAISVWDRRAAAEAGKVPPPRFLEAVAGYLHELNFPRARIKVEAFG